MSYVPTPPLHLIKTKIGSKLNFYRIGILSALLKNFRCVYVSVKTNIILERIFSFTLWVFINKYALFHEFSSKCFSLFNFISFCIVQRSWKETRVILRLRSVLSTLKKSSKKYRKKPFKKKNLFVKLYKNKYSFQILKAWKS